jgi:hypothetical protein
VSFLRDGLGALLVLAALGALLLGLVELRGHDYVGALLLTFAGLSLLRGGVELLRGTVGE